MGIELLWPVVTIAALVALGLLGWCYITLSERLRREEAERTEAFLVDRTFEVSNIRAHYDALYDNLHDRMLSMLDMKALREYTEKRTADKKLDYVHEERKLKAELELAKPQKWVPPAERGEPAEQIGAGASMLPEDIV